ELVGAEGGEVLVHQRLGLGRQRDAEGITRLFGFLLAPRGEGQRFPLLVPLHDAGARRILDRRRRNESGRVVTVGGDSPEGIEAPVEWGEFFRARDEDGAKPEVELVPIAEARAVET